MTQALPLITGPVKIINVKCLMHSRLLKKHELFWTPPFKSFARPEEPSMQCAHWPCTNSSQNTCDPLSTYLCTYLFHFPTRSSDCELLVGRIRVWFICTLSAQHRACLEKGLLKFCYWDKPELMKSRFCPSPSRGPGTVVGFAQSILYWKSHRVLELSSSGSSANPV